MKKLIYILLLFTINFYCQNKVNPKFSDYEFINDSLVLKYVFNANEINGTKINPKYLFYYKHHIYNINENDEVAIPKHWSVPIIVFFDKKIPQEIKKDFITFISILPKHKNLKITITNNINDANYYFKDTNEEINIKDSHPAITYSLITDHTYKNTGGILKINCSKILDIEEQKRLIRQYFFLSLTQACQSSKKLKENTLLSKHYELSNELSEYDKIILTTHYDYYNRIPLELSNFNEIQAKTKDLEINNQNFKIDLDDE